MTLWPVVPLCKKQLRDIDPKDILNDRMYRKCNTYKSGGGYDRFPSVLKSFGFPEYSKQFVVQVQGCPLSCSYCYVTQDGIHGEPTMLSSGHIVQDFVNSEQDIFHLMGGAPGLYLNGWTDIIDYLPKNAIFHSDLLLCEGMYHDGTLNDITKRNAIVAISIKGWNEVSFAKLTGKPACVDLMRYNLRVVADSGLLAYCTFTGMSNKQSLLAQEWLKIPDKFMENSFIIDIINYDALK